MLRYSCSYISQIEGWWCTGVKRIDFFLIWFINTANLLSFFIYTFNAYWSSSIQCPVFLEQT
uniref:Uncharacterized protein n=1 Tax=Rhizophora mucronata TaxID=61149 RepID=A0A2P2QNA8_RHIMU